VAVDVRPHDAERRDVDRVETNDGEPCRCRALPGRVGCPRVEHRVVGVELDHARHREADRGHERQVRHRVGGVRCGVVPPGVDLPAERGDERGEERPPRRAPLVDCGVTIVVGAVADLGIGARGIRAVPEAGEAGRDAFETEITVGSIAGDPDESLVDHGVAVVVHPVAGLGRAGRDVRADREAAQANEVALTAGVAVGSVASRTEWEVVVHLGVAVVVNQIAGLGGG